MTEKSYSALEDQYQTVNVRKTKEDLTTTNTVEEILKKIVPAKSFLYRNHDKKNDRTFSSYLPMDTGTPKKPRRFFRMSSYEYPIFSSKTTKTENLEDRGYYSVKTNSRYYIQKTFKIPESRNKYKSITAPEISDVVMEDHLYEDLCYNDVEKSDPDKKDQTHKPYKVMIQELFQSFKLPFFKRSEEVVEEIEEVKEVAEKEKESNFYENGDIGVASNMYDSVQAVRPVKVEGNDRIPVEDYLEPIQVDRERQYCDVDLKDDSLLQYIMSLFESFGMRRETNDDNSDDSEVSRKQPSAPEAEAEWKPKNNMADRPLPVPVENEPYYMNIDRSEAENLLKGEPDGTFILRPSSQPNHAYTLTVSCAGGVHNVGVRRRSDGRLALGYARRGARSFPSVGSLLRHHRRRRLLLVAGGGVVGATTLNEPPRYYQAPSSIPVPLHTAAATADMDDQSTDAEAGASHAPILETGNGDVKMLKRMETVPDIKRDASGITTQYIAAGIVNLGAFAAGVSVAWSSSALPLLTPSQTEADSLARVGVAELVSQINGTHPRLRLTEYEASWVASLLCLGAVFGSVPAGLISEYFGRKKTLLYLALPLVVSWILVASSPNVYGLYVGRFVGGVAVGAFSVAIPPYVADIAEKQLLPTLANFYHVHFAGGVLFGYIIGMVQSTSWLSVLCASIPTAFFIAFIFLPESPAYYMSQGKTSEAKSALRYFRGIDNDIDAELKVLKEHIRNYARNRVTFKQLFQTRSTAKALVVSFGLMIFQQMSGIYPVLFYAEKIFKTFAISLNPPGAAIILGFCLVSSTYFSTMLLRSFRRRVLLMASFLSMAVSLGTLAIYYHMKAASLQTSSTWVPLFTLCMYVTAYAMGVGPIPWLMLREIFPANVTRRASAITAGFHWFLAFGATKLYQNLVDLIGPGWTLWHFAVTCIVATIFIYFFVPETKGKTYEDIQKEFDGIHKKKTHIHVIEVESVSDA